MITEDNLKICEEYHWQDDSSKCHRVLGDLDADSGKHVSARKHYDEAMRIARSISNRTVLIEALLARGRWYGKFMKDANAAFSDLNEVLGYATDGGYRIYEADIRIALAWAHLADNEKPIEERKKFAQNEADRARNMSEQMGYYWGKIDAAEVIAKM